MTTPAHCSPPSSPMPADFADVYLDESDRDENEKEDGHYEVVKMRPYMLKPTGSDAGG